MRKYIASSLAIATLVLAGCGSSKNSGDATGADSLTTAPPTSSVDLAAPTTTLAQTTDTATMPTTAPQSTAPVASVAPKAPATTTAPKAPTSTRVPQMQLSGTPEEQLSQVVAATEKVAAFPVSSREHNDSFGRLNESLVSYGIEVKWDPNDEGLNIYQISMGGQSVCFLWAYADGAADSRSLQPHSCS